MFFFSSFFPFTYPLGIFFSRYQSRCTCSVALKFRTLNTNACVCMCECQQRLHINMPFIYVVYLQFKRSILRMCMTRFSDTQSFLYVRFDRLLFPMSPFVTSIFLPGPPLFTIDVSVHVCTIFPSESIYRYDYCMYMSALVFFF